MRNSCRNGNTQQPGSLMLFELRTKEPSEIEFLGTKDIKGITETAHLDGTIGHDPELILGLGENDGSVRCQGLLARAETYEQFIRPHNCVLRLTTCC